MINICINLSAPHMQKTIHSAQKGFILDESGEKLLVIKYQSDKYQNAKLAGKYGLPGGKIEFGESPNEAFVREVAEETGYKVEPGIPFYCYSWVFTKEDGSQHQIVAVARLGKILSDGGDLKPDEETSVIAGAEFIPLTELNIDNVVFDEFPAIELYLQLKNDNPFK